MRPDLIVATSAHRRGDTRLRRRFAHSAAAEGFRVTYLYAHRGEAETEVEEIHSAVEEVAFGRHGHIVYRAFVLVPLLFFAVAARRPRVVLLADPETYWLSTLFFLLRIKVIIDCHELYFAKLGHRGVHASLVPIAALFLRLYFGVTTMCSSERFVVAPGLEKQFWRDSNVLRNLPEREMFASFWPNTFKQASKIVYTGGITRHRGIRQVLLALADLKTVDWCLTIAGPADPVEERELMPLLEDSRVTYLGVVPYTRVIEEVTDAIVAVMCNQPGHGYEASLPNKLFEYMLSGTAIVCSDFERWKRLVEASGFGVCCDPADLGDIRAKISALLVRADQASKMGEAARKYASEAYCWEAEKQKLLVPLRELVKKSA